MHIITAAGLSARISDLGAELQSLTLADGRELLWQGDAAHWSGRSPVLFPIVGRAAEDHLTVGGAPVTMAQHGFARRSRFELIASGPDFTRHLLTDSPATQAQFPRAFRLEVEHRLSDKGLALSATVTNSGHQPLPFGLGFHPAFAWPLPGCGAAPHEIELHNNAEPPRRALRDGLLTETELASPFHRGHLALTPGLFDEDALIFPEGAGSALRYGAEYGPGLEFHFENLPFLALWSKPGAPFLCIEPWQGMAARHGAGPALEDRPGTVTLAPGAQRSFTLRLRPSGF